MALPIALDARFASVPPPIAGLDHVRAFGSHSLAYSALQRSIQLFEHPNGGAIAYREYFGHHLVLGDPLCSKSCAEQTINEFIAKHDRPIFAQVGKATAEILATCGFHITPVGCDTELDVTTFTRAGHAKRDLRRAWNRAERAGLSVSESRDCAALRFELALLSERWMRTRSIKRRELSFLVRPLEREPESGTRIFVAMRESRLVGFVLFDPRYRAGCNVGYTASILRTEPDAPAGTIDFILLNAMEQFRQEGVRHLSLGVMPFHDLERSRLASTTTAQPLHTLLRFIARTDCAPFLNIHGLNFHKSRYRPETQPVYLAARSSTGLLPMTLLTRACGLLP